VVKIFYMSTIVTLDMTKTMRKKARVAIDKKTRKRRETMYSKREFNSGDGMLTTVWGPSLWHSLHTISFNYPVEPTKEDKKYYREFILNLCHVLPCKYCRMNLKNNFKSLPLKMSDMKNRDSFSRYIYNLHEVVNKMLNKRSGLTYTDVRKRYEHFRARCNSGTPMDLWNKKTIRKHTSATIKQTAQEMKNKTRSNKKRGEKGCTEPLYAGSKAKCIIKIVPQESSGDTFQMDKKCEKKKLVPG
jgi:hypothetical protein